MKTNTTISFKTTNDLNQELEDVSALLGVSKSQLIKRLITQGLNPLKAELEPLLKLKNELKSAVELSNGWVTEIE